MKQRKLFWACIVVAIVCLCLMRWLPVAQPAKDDDTIVVNNSTLPVVADVVPMVYGHLGDGTGMSCFEFITESGDTLVLNRVSEFTGNEASVLGDMIPDPSYLYSVMLADQDETAEVMVNMTQLRTHWTNGSDDLVLKADSTAASTIGNQYVRWLLSRDKLVLWRSASQEGGIMSEVADTMQVVCLSADTLVLRNRFGDEIKYHH